MGYTRFQNEQDRMKPGHIQGIPVLGNHFSSLPLQSMDRGNLGRECATTLRPSQFDLARTLARLDETMGIRGIVG